MKEIIAIVITSVLFLAGMFGTLVPVIPGAPIVWLGMLTYGFITGFAKHSVLFFVLQGVLAILVMATDYAFTAMGSRYFGGSKAAIFGAAAGLLIGLFFFPIGLLIGPFLGAVIADLIYKKNVNDAVKSGVGATLGFWLALPLKLLIVVAMISWFIFTII